jgi:hypothetical protein
MVPVHRNLLESTVDVVILKQYWIMFYSDFEEVSIHFNFSISDGKWKKQ